MPKDQYESPVADIDRDISTREYVETEAPKEDPAQADPANTEADKPADTEGDETKEKDTYADLPTITVEAFARSALSGDALTIAFVSCENRENGVRKLAEPKWRELYEEFLAAPR